MKTKNMYLILYVHIF